MRKITVVVAALLVLALVGGCTARANEKKAPEKSREEMQLFPAERFSRNQDGIPMMKVYDNGKITEMDVETYVEGVLAGEMKNDWPMEALKAQAILARTFVMKFVTEKESKYQGADISTDIEEAQAYDATGVNQRIQQAVAETRGMVLTSDGKLIYSWFHSHSGGKTAMAKEGIGWDREEPKYIKMVKGQEPENVKDEAVNKQLQEAASWEAYFSPQAFVKACAEQTVLIALSEETELQKGTVGESGRAITLQVDGQSVDAAELRIALGSTKMRSTLLTHFEMRDGKVYMAGKGYGHGVGMSQWGAYGLAEKGKKAKQIVETYFQNAVIETAW